MPTRAGFFLRLCACLLDSALMLFVTFACAPLVGAAAASISGIVVGAIARLAGATPDQIVGMAAVAGLLIGSLAWLLSIITLFYGVAIVYTLVEAFTAATPAKMLLGLRVRRADGGVPTRGQLLVRGFVQDGGALLWFLSFTGIPLLALSLPWNVLATLGCFLTLGPARQAFHDKVSGTAVFRLADLE